MRVCYMMDGAVLANREHVETLPKVGDHQYLYTVRIGYFVVKYTLDPVPGGTLAIVGLEEPTNQEKPTMDNQHRKIKGYRELSQDEIDAMNEIKEKGKELGELVDKLRALDVDQRWISIGATDLQQGLMALTRGVAKPEFF